jgi:hypothetical protein
MPTRKQRRRREKSFRHEWEYVEVDPETGEERPVAPAELRTEKPERPKPAPARKQQAKGGKPAARRGREPSPPSWRKVFKRTALFAPLMALFMYWTMSSSKNGVSVPAIVLNTAILIAFFAPFSYFVDSFTYRTYLKRKAKSG